MYNTGPVQTGETWKQTSLLCHGIWRHGVWRAERIDISVVAKRLRVRPGVRSSPRMFVPLPERVVERPGVRSSPRI